jgi:hypothetical protein
MFYTVFSTNLAPRMQWQSDLLEYSWKQVGQEGVLIRLVATDDPATLPQQKYAQCIATQPWNTHPDTKDAYPIYNKPASLLEWLFRDRPEGTVLLIDPDCVFRRPVRQHVAAGFPVAQKWIDRNTRKPGTQYPFGLPPGFAFLNDYCARVDLSTAPVMIPTLIHTSDLRRICARWLELCGIVRQHARNVHGQPIWEADMYAYLVTSAEYQLNHEPASLGICTNWRSEDAPDAPIIHYCQPIIGRDGQEIFNKFRYQPWTSIDPAAEPENQDYGKDLIDIVNARAAEADHSGARVALHQRPIRRDGIMEGRVMDDILLEVPADGRSLWLNVSGKATWDLCDGEHTIGQMKAELGKRFQADERQVGADIVSLVEQLHRYGFLDIH